MGQAVPAGGCSRLRRQTASRQPRRRQRAEEAEESGQQEGCNGEEVSHGRNDRQPDEQEAAGRRKTLIGEVVSTKMAKTIVVEVRRQKAHPFYKRVVARSKKFYAHDEEGTAHAGRLCEDRRDPPAVQAEALAVEGNCAARGLVAPVAVEDRRLVILPCAGKGLERGTRRECSTGGQGEKLWQ